MIMIIPLILGVVSLVACSITLYLQIKYWDEL